MTYNIYKLDGDGKATDFYAKVEFSSIFELRAYVRALQPTAELWLEGVHRYVLNVGGDMYGVVELATHPL